MVNTETDLNITIKRVGLSGSYEQILNVANTTATTFVFDPLLSRIANSVQCQFNITGVTYTWTAILNQVTVTIDSTLANGSALPAAIKILAADVKYIP
jgi:hypothetical protein